MKPGETKKIQNFIEQITVVELKSSIKIEAIKLRKKYSLKTPDAIIAGTALRLQSSLMTNDQKLLSISEIETYSVII
ncbi:MAG: PIN domain-containing protein [Cyanobacteria bacterium J06621_8]